MSPIAERQSCARRTYFTHGVTLSRIVISHIDVPVRSRCLMGLHLGRLSTANLWRRAKPTGARFSKLR